MVGSEVVLLATVSESLYGLWNIMRDERGRRGEVRNKVVTDVKETLDGSS
jgi:hypothetical protein